jgi:hypothetical protein
MDFETLQATVRRAGKSQVPVLFCLGSVWLDWIGVRKDEITAIADLPRIEVLMEHVARLDASYRAGAVHLCLAMLAAVAQDDAETVRKHFQSAIGLSGGKNLTPGVYYAMWLRANGEAQSCRQLLEEIVKKGAPEAPEYSLLNQLALDKARRALAEINKGKH